MSAGKYRHRVQLQSKTLTPDSHGNPVETWATASTVWAAVKPISGRERWANDRTSHDYDLAVSIRYRTGIAPDMRAIYNSRTLEVSTIVDTDERRRELVLLCRETDIA